MHIFRTCGWLVLTALESHGHPAMCSLFAHRIQTNKSKNFLAFSKNTICHCMQIRRSTLAKSIQVNWNAIEWSSYFIYFFQKNPFRNSSIKFIFVVLLPSIFVWKKSTFLCRIHVRPEHVFGVGSLHLIQRSQFNLIQFELESGSHFGQLDICVNVSERMMSECDVIVVIGERDHTFRILLRHREQMLQNWHCPFGQFRLEIVKYQMRFLLTHRPNVGHIVSHYYAAHVEVGGRAERQMANDQIVGYATMFVHENQVGHIIGSGRVNQLLHLVITAIHSLGIRKNQSQFFDEHFQSGRRITGGSYHDLRIFAASISVFIVLWIRSIRPTAEPRNCFCRFRTCELIDFGSI